MNVYVKKKKKTKARIYLELYIVPNCGYKRILYNCGIIGLMWLVSGEWIFHGERSQKTNV